MQALTTNEVVALFGLEARRVQKEVEHGVIEPRRFGLPAVLYLRALSEMGVEVSAVADRKRLYALIRRAWESRVALRIQLSRIVELQLDALCDEVMERVGRFEAWKQTLVVDDRILAGEPVFPRTRLAVRNIGGMYLRGASVRDLQEDYPYLSEQDIELASIYARAYPPRGRPSSDGKAPAR
jgi:uncharacterized protein (DUF433 family)